ncbi:transmembrane anchor protein [Collimonas silvisoli]|uniref:transmembrane anchor protein n=1 Tax=Collimonas silvisoli TaxID=2825884 RepID=UPI001B8C7EFB|nr:transmembrane anchor protein [Collimonas silvisoli]
MTPAINPTLPTLPQLRKATGIAIVAAAAILIAFVLPAEYGIDVTGIGKALEIKKLGADSAQAPSSPVAATAAVTAAAANAPEATLIKSRTPFNESEMSLTLQPNEGGEIKALMQQGEHFVYAWSAEGGKVTVDMHGERPNAGKEFTRYWKEKQQAGDQGSFVAPFDGIHGWFWRNHSDKPVTIKVKVSGFFEKLYVPH